MVWHHVISASFRNNAWARLRQAASGFRQLGVQIMGIAVSMVQTQASDIHHSTAGILYVLVPARHLELRNAYAVVSHFVHGSIGCSVCLRKNRSALHLQS